MMRILRVGFGHIFDDVMRELSIRSQRDRELHRRCLACSGGHESCAPLCRDLLSLLSPRKWCSCKLSASESTGWGEHPVLSSCWASPQVWTKLRDGG